MKKFAFILTTYFAIFSIGVYAQNPVWTLPPYYSDGTYTYNLPTVPTSEIGYYGDPATTVSNAMVDANGDLLFFIVDGMVYDKEGYSMRSLNDVINSNMGLIGTAEVAIVPVPGNCNQYYILLSGRKNYSTLSSKLPVVALLDLSVPSYHYPDRIGDLIYGTTIEDILPAEAPNIEIELGYGKQGSSYFAVSKENNGKRFVFISNPSRIFRFIIDDAGFHYDGFIPVTYHAGNNDIGYRGEMELVEVNNNGNVKYRLAFYLPYVPPMNSPTLSSNLVYIYNLDSTGEITLDNNGWDKYYLPYENSSQIPIMDRAS